MKNFPRHTRPTMRPHLLLLLLLQLCLPAPRLSAAEPEFPLTPDSKPQPDVPKGELIKDSYTSTGGIFPGTEREYQIYIPHGLDRTKPAAFMVFQDGVIYQAPVVFDNLIARKDIPPLVGIFIKPGVVHAANENALPRFNRSYEYDSITDNYARFLIEEFLPAIEGKHRIYLSTDPNDAAIAGNSSGGIAAFMVAWHRPDRFRRVFTGVGTYVGIHGGDQLPVLVRKYEPKPIRIFLQSGTGDNNLYCGDWWMANQMMERSLTWAGYDVNHAWGEGGHNQKHASQIFPDVLRWLWRDWQTNKEIKANAKGESKWRGWEVVEEGKGWEAAAQCYLNVNKICANSHGDLYCLIAGDYKDGQRNTPFPTPKALQRKEPPDIDEWIRREPHEFVMASSIGFGVLKLDSSGGISHYRTSARTFSGLATNRDGAAVFTSLDAGDMPAMAVAANGGPVLVAKDQSRFYDAKAMVVDSKGYIYAATTRGSGNLVVLDPDGSEIFQCDLALNGAFDMAMSPDQTQLYITGLHQLERSVHVWSYQVTPSHSLINAQKFFKPELFSENNDFCKGLCVDTDGRLYVATALGIQVCDQAGRVNFIIPTPQLPHGVCFGGKDLNELFVACGGGIYKRPMKVRGVVTAQMPPIKPKPPKL